MKNTKAQFVKEIFWKIKSLEIQGAERIAIAAVTAFAEKSKQTKDKKELQKTVELLESARPTEPALKNALKYCLLNYEKDPFAAETVINHFKAGKEKIISCGAKKIKSGMIVFTHCHSSTVMGILIKAQKQSKRFKVHCTETRPKYQGRITAVELAKAGIPVEMCVDSAARLQIQKADLFLFGTDAITAEGNIINKIGTTMIAEFAHMNQIPAYACTNSWKFDSQTIHGNEVEIENRDPKEIWADAPKGVKIINPAFEMTQADRISGIITELGIFKPETLILEIQKEYPWMV